MTLGLELELVQLYQNQLYNGVCCARRGTGLTATILISPDSMLK